MNINEYMRNNRDQKSYIRMVREVKCADGFHMSVQASEYTYCTPRINDARHYSAVEIGFPSEREEMIMNYAEDANNPTGTVYGWAPVEIVDAVIAKHGGYAE